MHWFCLGIPVVVAISTAAHVSVQVRILSLLFGYQQYFLYIEVKKSTFFHTQRSFPYS